MRFRARSDEPDSGELVEHLFRTEAGNLCARLVRVFGPQHLQLVEDVVQESMVRALRVWAYEGVPENPRGWLYRVARNLALDVLRRDANFRRKRDDYAYLVRQHATNLASPRFAEELVDDQLALIFTCCIPDLPRPAQVALTLKTACGFSVEEIAAAFLARRSAVAQRLVRARARLRDGGIALEVPPPESVPDRLDAVLEVIYLLFNEGYCASRGDALVRRDLCSEALRLLDILLQRETTALPETHALTALVCLQSSRLESRVDAAETSVLLREQQRDRWSAELMRRGFRHLQAAANAQDPTSFHLEAAIAACHASAKGFEETDWERIVTLYDGLIVLRPTPIVRLNRAIALAHASGPESGLEALGQIGSELADHFLFHAARAELLERLGRTAEAVDAWRSACGCDLRPAQYNHVRERLNRLGAGTSWTDT